MKTVLGKLVSVQPISLSKAARYISDFASFENNGASEVVSVYLNRASEAFGSLVQLHKDLKHPQSSHKKQRKKSHDGTSLRIDERSHAENQDRRVNGVIKEEDKSVRVGGIDDIRKIKKGKEMHKKESINLEDSVISELRKAGENGGNVEVQNMVNGFEDQTKKTKKKKKKEENENTQEGSKMEDIDDGGSRGGENGSGLRIEKGERKDEKKKIKKRKEENKVEETVKKEEPEVEQGKKNKKRERKDEEKERKRKEENEVEETVKKGESEVGQGKKSKKKKREEIEMKEVGREVKLDVAQEKESKKKKRKSVDLDDELKANSVDPTRKKQKKSKVSDD